MSQAGWGDQLEVFLRLYKRSCSRDIRQALYESVNRCSPYPKTLMSPLRSGRGLTGLATRKEKWTKGVWEGVVLVIKPEGKQYSHLVPLCSHFPSLCAAPLCRNTAVLPQSRQGDTEQSCVPQTLPWVWPAKPQPVLENWMFWVLSGQIIDVGSRGMWNVLVVGIPPFPSAQGYGLQMSCVALLLSGCISLASFGLEKQLLLCVCGECRTVQGRWSDIGTSGQKTGPCSLGGKCQKA